MKIYFDHHWRSFPMYRWLFMPFHLWICGPRDGAAVQIVLTILNFEIDIHIGHHITRRGW